ncbi:hypothetical protein PVBG_05048 [Plasmodium vivax Brazil I]|uniref:Variable surface protein Vir18 n=1 Tax=Plasmodium vivax (strain Brazil I) TaxID=1033975 RepID=A0A0J9SYD0_PLAV1|nr:hypothetical protein PVBG_05048 [Plasmodium vivax Brazil I]
MSQLSQYIRSIWGRYQQFNDNRCLTDFAKFKNEIEQKISALNRKNPNAFCNECVKVKESITGKDREFKKCYVGRSKKLNLIEDNIDIKSFIDECIVFPECVRKRSAHNRPVPLRSTNTGLCEKNDRCNNENSRTRGVGRKEQQGLDTETSRTGSSRTQKPQSTGAQQVEGKDSKQETIVSQTRTIANTLPNPVTTQHGGSESVKNHQHITSEQVETSTQPSTTSGHKSTKDVDSHALSPPPLSRSDQKSDSDIPLEQSHTDIDPIQKNSTDDKPDGNSPGERDTAAQIDVKQDIARQAGVTETPDSAIHADKVFVQKDPSGANIDLYGEAVVHDHPGTRNPEIKDSVTERSNDSDTIHGITSDGGGYHTEVSYVNNAGNEAQSNASSCIGNPCSNEQSTEINSHNSETLGMFNHISKILLENQGHMIKASIPMGIVLLLTFLFKYTPLWKILTKRKRNKQSHMKEKLQRVLQQPSIEREERSVPFSYSAFEYSS